MGCPVAVEAAVRAFVALESQIRGRRPAVQSCERRTGGDGDGDGDASSDMLSGTSSAAARSSRMMMHDARCMMHAAGCETWTPRTNDTYR